MCLPFDHRVAGTQARPSTAELDRVKAARYGLTQAEKASELFRGLMGEDWEDSASGGSSASGASGGPDADRSDRFVDVAPEGSGGSTGGGDEALVPVSNVRARSIR